MKSQILFSTFRESTVSRTKAVYVMLPMKTEYVSEYMDFL